jgi:hypothetical protein
MKTVEVICEFCQDPFQRSIKEYNRSIRNKTKMFCDRSCACSYGLKVSPRKGDASRLNPANKLDKFSPFRYFVSKSRSEERKSWYGESDLTIEYLQDLWEKQNGICPYTNYQMELPQSTQDAAIKGTPKRASLDRMDSNKGYIQGNVEFVCLAVNYAKNRFSRDDMMSFFVKS